MKRSHIIALASLVALVIGLAQQPDILIKLTQGERAAIALPDFRGSGRAAGLMQVFNRTLFSEIQESGLFRMVPKSLYPLQVPQRPQDFIPPAPSRPGGPPERRGPWLTDWSNPPVDADYLAFGYAAEQEGRLVVFGWFYNVNQPTLESAQVFGKVYFGDLTEEGARQVAQEFAADILGQFGFETLAGTKIYFVSDRTGYKEIWVMDHDGSNQRQFTHYRSITTFPAVSPDGTKIVFTTFAPGHPAIYMHSTITGRRLPFFNQPASMNATASFTPDGQKIVFSSTMAGGYAQIYICNIDGSGLRRLTYSRSIDVEPKVNPKTGNEIVFVSGRSGSPQIYKMNIDGANVVRLTDGEGEAVNPAWHPDGQHIAFSWTRGYEPGNYNVFVMDVATRQYVQLTHGAGRNENPNWAPDGRHIVFASNRSGSMQIWTMLADGTQLRQLTTQGRNEKPVWSRGPKQ